MVSNNLREEFLKENIDVSVVSGGKSILFKTEYGDITITLSKLRRIIKNSILSYIDLQLNE